ncbi:hypothetical protein SAMN02910344_01034 [Ruminobacter amylophilus]|uniref:Replication restart DNA helicase PriA n=1 Tax=Ruminobacter amylophilus TaxID=867 RepID=A0A662ZGP1_9GAMM|nr:hypothetical protein [Ruminobacter amylophilus]SFP30682.1 hypothetical protein SAMN02910344_01034 [Ruminobacter amylophilus]
MKTSEHTRCPNCSGNMTFNIREQRLVCESCSSRFTVYQYDRLLREKKEAGVENFARGAVVNESDSENSETDLHRSYICSSCGGEITPGVLSTTENCPFCGNAIVFTDKYRDQRVPDRIVPFKKDKEDFLEIYRKILKSKRFVPDSFLVEARVEKIKAWYAPFWLYDMEVSGNAAFKVEKVKPSGKKYEHTVYSGVSTGRAKFYSIPQDASVELDDRISQGLEPYNVQNAPEFNFAWLSGLDAEIYNMDHEGGMISARRRVERSFDRYLSGSKDYEYYLITHREYSFKAAKISYALFPLWHMNISWAGRKYMFSMNGESGKALCIFPISEIKLLCCVFFSWLPFLTFSCWLTTVDEFMKIRDSGKGMGVLFLGYSFLVYSVFSRYMFNRNLTCILSSVLFTLISSFFVYLYLTGADSSGDHLLAMIAAGIVIVVGMVGTYVAVKKSLKKEYTLKLKKNSDDYINFGDCELHTKKDVTMSKILDNSGSVIKGINPKEDED